jgi:oxygen-independent coproporphyrinogen-3 oxidase
VSEYLEVLLKEVDAIGALAPGGHRVCHIHWGGGSPDILAPSDILLLGRALRARFSVAADAEFAVEIDPRRLVDEQVDSFAGVGVNRVSIGVQDFDEAVQRAIGRIQSFDTTQRAVQMFRRRGVGSINVDLVYGLPLQTEDSLARTLDQVLQLQPDRIAVFGYAHLPDRLKHQRLIDEAALPDAVARFAQARLIALRLVEAGYVEIGIDHFSRPDDALAKAPLARNFQGYTTDKADALLGFGASAISRLPNGFAQNAVAVDDYARRILGGELATARGHQMQGEDGVRAAVIEQLMCMFSVSWADLQERFGDSVQTLRRAFEEWAAQDESGFVTVRGDGFEVAEFGKPFVRTICAMFDAYLSHEIAQRRHAIAV